MKKEKRKLFLGGTLISASMPIVAIVSLGDGASHSDGKGNIANTTQVSGQEKSVKDLDSYKDNILANLGSTKNQQINVAKNRITHPSPVQITETKDGYIYKMPNFAVFEGQVGNVSLTTQFTSGTNIDENLNIEYYSLAKESTDASIDIVNHDTTTAWNVSDGDSVFVKITPKDGTTLINGQNLIVGQFAVSGIGATEEGSPYNQYYVSGESTANAYEKLANKNANYDDIYKLMDLMNPGEIITKGAYQLQMPNVDGSKIISPSAPIPSSASLPFVDISMGATGAPDMEAFQKYKYMSFGFIAGATTGKGVKSGQWGGVSDLGDENIIDIINAVCSKGGDVVPSIGGLNEGSAIWENADPIVLVRWIELLALQFNLQRIDYDIEGQHLSSKSLPVYAAATALAQKKLEKSGHKLELTLTIAAEWDGLAIDGINTLNEFVASGANITKLNGMTMMMNPEKVAELGGLAGAVNNSVTSMKNQIQTAYNDNGLVLTNEQAYQKIGTTIDISSDTWEGERFTVQELENILLFAEENKIGQLSYWSAGSEDPDINGMKMTAEQWAVVASGLGLPTEGQTAGQMQKNVIKKLNGKLPAYGTYSKFDNGGSTSVDTLIPNASDLVLDTVNLYANESMNANASVFDTINFNLPTFEEKKQIHPDGLASGTKVISKGLGGIMHIFEAKFWATDAPWPATPSAQWKDLGIAISSLNTGNTLAVAQTIAETYKSQNPTYIRSQNADGSTNNKPKDKSSNPNLTIISDMLASNLIVNIPEFDQSDLSRNHYVKGEMTFYDNNIYISKWDTGTSTPGLGEQWDSNYIPLA